MDDREQKASDAQTPEPAEKRPWVKPDFRGSAEFDKQALACAMNDSFFPCLSTVSGG